MKHYSVLFVLSSLLLLACTKEKIDFSKTSLDVSISPELGIPLAYGDISLKNIVTERPDTLELYRKVGDPDSLCIRLLQYKDTTLIPHDLVDYPEIQPIEKSKKLGNVKLNDQTAQHVILFSDFIDDFDQSAKDFFGANDGNTVAVAEHSQVTDRLDDFPSFPELEWARFAEGICEVEVKNHYAVPVEMVIEILNDGAVIGTVEFIGANHVPSNGFRRDNFSIAGVRLEPGMMQYRLTKMKVLATSTATIGLNQQLEINAELQGAVVSAGRAELPRQIVAFDTSDFFTVKVKNDRKLHHLLVKSGSLDVQINSSLGESMSLGIKLPSVTRDGVPFSDSVVVRNASRTKILHLDNLFVDLQQNPQQRYNSLPYDLHYYVDTHEEMITFSADNEIGVIIENNTLIDFGYLDGHMGYDEEQFADDLFDFEFDEFLEMYKSGKVIFTDPKLHIDIYNSLGISGTAKLKMSALGMNGEYESLFENPKAKIFELKGPAFDQRNENLGSQMEHTPIYIDRNTSNIVNVMAILPEHVDYKGSFLLNDLNKGVTEETTINYMYDTSSFRATVLAEIPMEFQIDDLILEDEYDFSIDDISSDIEDFESIKLYLWEENHFPFQLQTKLTLLDTTQVVQELYTLDTTIIKAAATIDDGAIGKVPRTKPVQYETGIELTRGVDDLAIDALFKANKIRVQLLVKTEDGEDNTGVGYHAVTMYTYYNFKFRLSCETKVNVKTGE